MNDDIEQLLTSLKLKRMQEVFDRETSRAEKQEVSYTEFTARLLREEYHDRLRRAGEARVRRAKMPEEWTLETFPWARQPGVDRKQIRELAELDFVRTGTNVVFRGKTGAGKTGLAIGLLLKALQEGYRGLFVKAQDLFDEAYASLADRSTRKFLDRLIRFDVVVIDEVGFLNLRPEQTNIFFRMMEERYTARRASIITTNLEYDEWGIFLGNKPLTEALLSRIRHRCVTVEINGPTLRTPEEDIDQK
jgi:DNA replication protein DnaC